MKKISIPIVILMAATLSACGSDFEWFPKVSDVTPPTVLAILSNNSSLTNGRTFHVTTLPASITFRSSEASTVYYTTNGSDPTGSPLKIQFTGADSAIIPGLISTSNTVLKFFGLDLANPGNASAIQSATIISP